MQKHKFNIWLLLLIGWILGIVGAIMYMNGLFAIWHPLGKPPENITKINGLVDDKIYVTTVSGVTWSFSNFRFHYNDEPLPRKEIIWTKVNENYVISEPYRNDCDRFITWPPLFRIEQHYEMSFPQIEGINCHKFAVTKDGTLWTWNYGIGSLSGISYFFLPIFGLLAGLVLVLGIKLIQFIRRRVLKDKEKPE
jgi:hypothetical protein